MNKIRFILCLGCLLTIICVQANDSTLNKKQVRWQRWEQNEEKSGAYHFFLISHKIACPQFGTIQKGKIL